MPKHRRFHIAILTFAMLLLSAVPCRLTAHAEDKFYPGALHEDPSRHSSVYTIAIAGDILFDPAYTAGNTFLARGVEGSYDADALRAMRGADLFIVNNEFTYTRTSNATPKSYNFRTDPSNAALLQEMGADLVTLGNNHTWDYGEAGFLDTLKTLEDIGMPYVGAGRNLEEAMAPIVWYAGDMSIAILNATEVERSSETTRGAGENSPGVFRCYNPNRLYEAIRQADERYDFVIVIPHWGIEGQSRPDERQKNMAKGMVDAGADLIVGGHPHVLQSIEYVKGVPVVYSMGNYLFHSGTRDTGLLRVSFDGKRRKLRSVQFLAMESRNCRTLSLHGKEKERLYSELRSLSPKVHIDRNGFILPTDRKSIRAVNPLFIPGRRP